MIHDPSQTLLGAIKTWRERSVTVDGALVMVEKFYPPVHKGNTLDKTDYQQETGGLDAVQWLEGRFKPRSPKLVAWRDDVQIVEELAGRRITFLVCVRGPDADGVCEYVSNGEWEYV